MLILAAAFASTALVPAIDVKLNVNNKQTASNFDKIFLFLLIPQSLFTLFLYTLPVNYTPLNNFEKPFLHQLHFLRNELHFLDFACQKVDNKTEMYFSYFILIL